MTVMNDCTDFTFVVKRNKEMYYLKSKCSYPTITDAKLLCKLILQNKDEVERLTEFQGFVRNEITKVLQAANSLGVNSLAVQDFWINVYSWFEKKKQTTPEASG